MPELPEVQTVVATLTPRVLGATIQAAEILRADYAAPRGIDIARMLRGRRIVQIRRRGKRIIFELDSGERFLVHLGMTGRLTLQAAGADRLVHTHVVLRLRDGDAQMELHLRDPRRFGQFVWLGRESGEDGLGPEPLTITPRRLCGMLSGSRRPIKSLLLDQGRLAGLGNIYADESLFLAGVHPLTPANELGEEAASRLCRAIKQVLRKAIRHRGSTLRDYVDAQGGKGAFQLMHNVYDRSREPCRRCGTPIVRVVVAGRSTCYCPACQPGLPTK